MEVKFKKLLPDIRLPEFAHTDDAGADLFSREDKVLAPGEHYGFNLGFATEIPAGYVALVHDKSGLAVNHGLTCLAGVIDAGYRGEWSIVILNSSSESYEVHSGDKIAQVLFQVIEQPIFTLVENLSASSRADGGFGSTGK